MSRRLLITSKDFLEARKNFDQIPTVHVSYAFSYLAPLQCNLVEHPIVDIWEDLDTLRFLQHGEYPPQVTSSHQDCIVVPPPHERPGLIQKGMFYCWSCDLIGELLQTSKGNVYIMIMIEHFSKWVELVALPDKSSQSTSQTFLEQVLNRFGACVKCLTNQGSEFRKEFQDLLDHVLINHHRTLRDHLQADGLAERMVQTCKKGLQRICLTRIKKDWDLALPDAPPTP
jgi:hypothetical protein